MIRTIINLQFDGDFEEEIIKRWGLNENNIKYQCYGYRCDKG